MKSKVKVHLPSNAENALRWCRRIGGMPIVYDKNSFRSTVGDAVRCLVVNAVTFWVPMGVYIGILGLVGKNYGFVM